MPRTSRPVAAFQGELGAFSHSAALKLLGENVALTPCRAFKDVFEAVAQGEANCAVVPIENTLHGSVHENYDFLLEYNYQIFGETSIRISHQLIAMPGVAFRQLQRVRSHPVALNQCKQFFDQHTKLIAEPYYDTAGSVKSLREQPEPHTGAIASEMAAAAYSGVILKRDIEDIRENFTRFFLLAKQPKTARDQQSSYKTSLVFSTDNVAGSLFRATACFALRGLNLTKIESRPFRGKPWEYLFYVDFLGSLNEKVVQSAIANLQECTQFVKLLGSYRPTP